MHSTYKIMFIDDDDDDRMLFTHALQHINKLIKCIAVSSCADALQKLQSGFIPDVVFLDLNMPQIHGFECLKLIKQSDVSGGVPVVIFSTSGHSTDIDKARHLGAAGYLKKPSDIDHLDKKINTFINHARSGSRNYLADI